MPDIQELLALQVIRTDPYEICNILVAAYGGITSEVIIVDSLLSIGEKGVMGYPGPPGPKGEPCECNVCTTTAAYDSTQATATTSATGR